MELYQVLCRRGVSYVTNEKALMYRIAKRKISRHYTLMERMQRFIPMTAKNENGDEIELSDLELDVSPMEDVVIDKVMLDTAKTIIKQKPEDVKKVFYLFYEAGQTIPEIAKALSISESNVKHKLYRTLHELRDSLVSKNSN
jgi:RNA polymerase sigma-70 factor (ECF subfamily)